MGWGWGAGVFISELGRRGRGNGGNRLLQTHQTGGKALSVRGTDLGTGTRRGKVWKWKSPFVSMLITPCAQHSTPSHLVSRVGFSPNAALGAGRVREPRSPAEGSAGPRRTWSARTCVWGKLSALRGSLRSSPRDIKSRRPSFWEGGGGFAQSLGTAGWGAGWGGQGQRLTARGPQGPPRSSWVSPCEGPRRSRVGPEQPAGLARARPPRRAPARGAALRASRPGPARRLRLPSQRGRAPRPSPGGNS